MCSRAVKMVSSVAKSNLAPLRSFCFLNSVFHFRNLRELTWLLITICYLTSQSLADEGDFMEEFLKREYSLVKPYRGEFNVKLELRYRQCQLTLATNINVDSRQNTVCHRKVGFGLNSFFSWIELCGGG